MNDEDDSSLAAFLEWEAAKPPVAPYRVYVGAVLNATATALEAGWPASQLEVELDYAYAFLQDAVAPADPSAIRAKLDAVVAHAVTNSVSAEELRAELEALFGNW